MTELQTDMETVEEYKPTGMAMTKEEALRHLDKIEKGENLMNTETTTGDTHKESQIIPFEKDGFGQLRTIETNRSIFFMAKDVALMLGYSNPLHAIRVHCKGVREMRTPSKGGTQSVNFIPESDVWRLIIKSKLPKAEQIEKWIMEEVLPTIRKTGGYQKKIDPVDAMNEVTNILLEQRKKIETNLVVVQKVAMEEFEKIDAFISVLNPALKKTAEQIKIPLPTKQYFNKTEAVKGAIRTMNGAFTTNDLARSLRDAKIDILERTLHSAIYRLIKQKYIRRVSRKHGSSPALYKKRNSSNGVALWDL